MAFEGHLFGCFACVEVEHLYVFPTLTSKELATKRKLNLMRPGNMDPVILLQLLLQYIQHPHTVREPNNHMESRRVHCH